MKQKAITVAITGGHLTPALAVIEEIQKTLPSWNIVWIGRKHAVEGSAVVSEEYRLVNALNIRFLPITAGRLQRSFTVHTMISLVKVPIGFFSALYYLRREKPDVVISFGGYVALPVVLAAWLLRIASVTHEQTRVVGLTNRIISRFARRIYLSFPSLEDQHGKSLVTGLPLRSGIFEKHPTPPLVPKGSGPLLYITGGSTGAVSLNRLIFAALPDLINRYRIVHQVGSTSLPEANRYALQVPEHQRTRYAAIRYLDIAGHAWMLQNADLIIGRSGANTVAEIAALGKIALFIPLPWSASDEQWENARYLVENGTSVMLRQSECTPASLIRTIDKILSDKAPLGASAQRFAKTVPRHAARSIVEDVQETVLPQLRK